MYSLYVKMMAMTVPPAGCQSTKENPTARYLRVHLLRRHAHPQAEKHRKESLTFQFLINENKTLSLEDQWYIYSKAFPRPTRWAALTITSVFLSTFWYPAGWRTMPLGLVYTPWMCNTLSFRFSWAHSRTCTTQRELNQLEWLSTCFKVPVSKTRYNITPASWYHRARMQNLKWPQFPFQAWLLGLMAVGLVISLWK